MRKMTGGGEARGPHDAYGGLQRRLAPIQSQNFAGRGPQSWITATREGLITASERPSAAPRDRCSPILQRRPSLTAARPPKRTLGS